MEEKPKEEAPTGETPPDAVPELPSREQLHVNMVNQARLFIKVEISRGTPHALAVSAMVASLAAAFDQWSENPATAPKMEADATALTKFIARFVASRFKGKIGLNYLVCLFFYALSFAAQSFGMPLNKIPAEQNGHAGNPPAK